jgi:hypothetical protein
MGRDMPRRLHPNNIVCYWISLELFNGDPSDPFRSTRLVAEAEEIDVWLM